MSAIAGSFLINGVKFACFVVIAYAGIVCGKKFKDKKDAEKANISQEGK